MLERLDELVERNPVSYLHRESGGSNPWALGRAELEPGSGVLDAGCGDSIVTSD